MGGHGALVLGASEPGSISIGLGVRADRGADAVPWGQKAFGGYLGADREAWRAYDASELMRAAAPRGRSSILIDQGLADQFLEKQLHPHLFRRHVGRTGQPLTLRAHPGYDHGYYFISTFVADHLRHHAKQLGGRSK